MKDILKVLIDFQINILSKTMDMQQRIVCKKYECKDCPYVLDVVWVYCTKIGKDKK